MTVNKCKMGGVLLFKEYGLFYQVTDDNAILLQYLLNIKLKRGIGYIPKNKMDKVIYILDRLSIDYLYNNNYHKFNNNLYSYYFDYAINKYQIKEIIDYYE